MIFNPVVLVIFPLWLATHLIHTRIASIIKNSPAVGDHSRARELELPSLIASRLSWAFVLMLFFNAINSTSVFAGI